MANEINMDEIARLKKAREAGSTVAGMQPDVFAMLMGNIAKNVGPNTLGGQVGSAAADMGQVLYKQRLDESNPERVLQQKRLDDILQRQQPVVDTKGSPPGFSIVPDSVAQNYFNQPKSEFTLGDFKTATQPKPEAPRPISFAEAEGLSAETKMGPMARQAQIAGLKQIQATTESTKASTDLLKQRTPYEVAQAKRTEEIGKATQQASIDLVNRQAELAATNADFAKRTMEPRIAQVGVELAKAQSEASLWEKKDRDYDADRLLPWEQLSVQKQQNLIMQDNNNLQRLGGFVNNLNTHTDAIVKANSKALSENTNPLETPNILISGANALISSGQSSYETSGLYKKIDSDGLLRKAASVAVDQGFQMYAEAINTSRSYEQNVKSTVQMLQQIEKLRKTQPEMAKAYKEHYFGPAGDVKSKSYKKWYNAKENFDVNATVEAFYSNTKGK